MKSYLTDRKQCIVDGNVRSSAQCNRSGVPQGSVLCPVLFLLFVNDLPLFVTEAYLDLYADDATMHTSSKNLPLSKINSKWGRKVSNLGVYRIKCLFILRKTSVMLTGARQTLSHTDPKAKYLDNELLKLVENQKLHSITIDNTLSWATQVDNVCQNVTKQITLMKLLSKYIDKTSLNQFYNSYILPILDYGCMVCVHCSVTYGSV